MIHQGMLTYKTPCSAAARVAAVSGHRVLAETAPGPDGRWTLETVTEADRIIAQLRQTAVAAVAEDPGAAARIELPELVDLALDLDTGQAGLAGGVKVWLDPVELEGFPRNFIGTLFARPGGITAIHLGECTLFPGSGPAVVPVQRGRYRLSGGTVSLRPGFGADALQLAGVTAKGSEKRMTAQDGVVIIDVTAPGSYRLVFERAVMSGNTIRLPVSGGQ